MTNTAEEEAVQLPADSTPKTIEHSWQKCWWTPLCTHEKPSHLLPSCRSSPGAGKTEVSKALVGAMESTAPKGSCVLRIDPDEFRVYLPGYQGNNSWLFQSAVSRILERVLDRAFSKSISFLLDVFVKQFFSARENVAALKREFGDQIVVDILIQEDLGSEQKIEIDVTAELIDGLMLEPYDEPMLYEALSHGAKHDDQT